MDFDLEDDETIAPVAYDEGAGEDYSDDIGKAARTAGEPVPTHETSGEPDLHNIVRAGPGAGRGWRVAISRHSPRRVYGQTFADAQHGGAAGALAAAQAWRDATEARYPGEPRRRRRLTPEASSVSGIIGVYRIVVWRRQPDGSALPDYFWRAVTPSPIAPRRCRVFSVSRYGEEEANRLAVAARRAFEVEAQAVVLESSVPELRGISRVERKQFGIWQVAFSGGTPERLYKKPFSDLFYGDRQLALAAAQAWRDEMERRHGEPGRPPAIARARARNAGGVVGVYRQRFVCRHADGSESEHFYWQARTPKGSRLRRSRTFYVDKYGEQEAYRLAVEARLAFEMAEDGA